jgi:hypothetical protein
MAAAASGQARINGVIFIGMEANNLFLAVVIATAPSFGFTGHGGRAGAGAWCLAVAAGVVPGLSVMLAE